MRVVFMGSPEYSISTLNALLESNHQVVAVVTQPDAPRGRGHRLMPCPVKGFALSRELLVYDFERVSRDGVEALKELQPDIIVTVAFGQILSSEILKIPKYGVINAHASLLPKYRGASPIQAAIANGETETGVTIMRTEVGLDTGDILLVKKTEICENETAGELSARLSDLSAEAVLASLELISKNKLMPKKQDSSQASICTKLTKSDSIINWARKAKQIKCQILSQNPSPIARTMLGIEQVKIYRARIAMGAENSGKEPGTVIAPTSAKAGVFVQCGNGVLEILEASFPSGKVLTGKNLVMGNKLKVGDKFETFPFESGVREKDINE